jgi:lipoprotein-anchoring transpeptidase ErfK/SrfK
VQHHLSRRKLLMSGLFFIAGSSVAAAKDGEGEDAVRNRNRRRKRRDPDYEDPWERDYDEPWDRIYDPDGSEEEYYDPELLPPPESEFDYPVEPVDPSLINSIYRRQMVEFQDFVAPGTIIIDPKAHFLYQALGNRQAMRYGVGVGRAGFAWAGNAEIRMKRRWPRWVPPKEMVARDKRARKWANGQPGGPDNPLGARALYLYSSGKDTLYRIHGTNEPQSIGKSVSSGCIRMLNEDVAELFDKVEIGTQVIVRSS